MFSLCLRKAFLQVALGFTGKLASKLRWVFIDEFDRMEQALKGKPTVPETKKESVQLCLNFDEPEPSALPAEKKIKLLMELVKLSPDDAQKIELIDQIAELI